MRNDWTPRTEKPTSQATRTTTNTTEAGSQSRAATRPGRPGHARPSARTRSASLTVGPPVGRLVLAERLADARDEPEIALGLARLDRALGGQVDVDDPARSDPAGRT